MTGVACPANIPIPAYTITLVKTVGVVKPPLRHVRKGRFRRTVCIVMFHLQVRSLAVTSRLARPTNTSVGLVPESLGVLTEIILEPVPPLLHIGGGHTPPSRSSGARAHVLIVHL